MSRLTKYFGPSPRRGHGHGRLSLRRLSPERYSRRRTDALSTPGKVPALFSRMLAMWQRNTGIYGLSFTDGVTVVISMKLVSQDRLEILTPLMATETRSRLIGFVCVAVTALGWGLNWPATKFLLTECPPLSARGICGLVAGLALFGVARFRGETLVVPRHLWGRLAVAALLNVSAWMGLTTVSMLWLPAGQAVTLAYTMPVWAALLAWPMLGDRPGSRQIAAIALGICGVVTLVEGAGLSLDAARRPGIALALSAAGLFAFGTVLAKRRPILLPRVTLVAWQVGIGCIPLLLGGLLFEKTHLDALPFIGWIALTYTALVSMGLCYVLWFAAVRRLKPSSAAVGTLLTPLIGVVASSVALGDPLTIRQIVSLALVVAGIGFAIKT
jgi:drug/metabolite transporter (DMT)-like permease